MSSRIAAAALLLAMAPACTPPSEPATNTATPAPAGTAEEVAGALRRAGLPVTSVESVTAARDPDQLLGEPGQYTSKVFFYDGRHPRNGGTDARNTIEVFGNVADTMRRGEILSQVSRPEDITERQMIQGKVYLRLGRAVSPAEANAYRKVLLTQQIGL